MKCVFTSEQLSHCNCPLRLVSQRHADVCYCRQKDNCIFPQTIHKRRIEDVEKFRSHFLETAKLSNSNGEQIDMAKKSTANKPDRSTQTTTATKKQADETQAPTSENNGQQGNESAQAKEFIEQHALTTKSGSLLWSRIRDVDRFIERFGYAVGKSGLFGTNRAEVGMALVASWMHTNEDPLRWKRRHHVMGTDITEHYAAMLADFRQDGGEYQIVERTPEKAAIFLKYKGNEFLSELTHGDASQEPYFRDKRGNPKGLWATPQGRKQMLWARAVSDGMKVVAPEIVFGIYTPEEAVEFAVPEGGFVISEPAEPEPTTTEETPATSADNEQQQADSAPFETEPVKLVTTDQLKQIKSLKDGLEIGSDLWPKVLDKYNVKSATKLTLDQADTLIGNMEAKLHKQQEKDELSAWADGATAKK